VTARWACILGHPVSHSLSPALHNAAFQALGIDAVYDARDVPPGDLLAVVSGFRVPSFLGANVTAPHKEAVLPMVDERSEEGLLVGAINTIVPVGGRLRGENTDAVGLRTWMMVEGIEPAGKDALVLGAGGAARATVAALARMGARRIVVLNRSLARAEALVADLSPHLSGTRLRAGQLDDARLPPDESPPAIVVNATSLGHQGAAPVVHDALLASAEVAVDLAYDPPESPFMRHARLVGTRAENGLGMLIYQAIRAFELWTGQTPPREVYAEAVARALQARSAALAVHTGAGEHT
jgi:shikimate dehydrogenase